MRISENERQIIRETIHDYIKDADIYLFGSRTDDNKRGGDIDLLVLSDCEFDLEEKLNILTALEMKGISRKVDLIIKSSGNNETKIVETALKEGQLL